MRLSSALLRTILPLVSLTAASALSAQSRLVRDYAEEQGLVAPPVWAIAEDSTGFLWIGAEGGLFRFDGIDFHRWAPATIHDVVIDVVVSPHGRILARQRNGELFEILEGDAARPITLPGTPSLVAPGSVTFDRDGTLWVIDASTVYHTAGDRVWRELPAGSSFEGELRRLDAGLTGVLITTSSGLFHAEPGVAPRRLMTSQRIAAAQATPDGRVLVVSNEPPAGRRLTEIGPHGMRELLPAGETWRGRAISVTARGGTVWVSVDRFLVGVRPGRPLDRLGIEHGVESGGPMLVDREGSLWLGSFSALHQFPEPETRLWSESDGVGRHTRFLARTGASLYVRTWSGTSRLRSGPAGVDAQGMSWPRAASNACSDGRGAVWTADTAGVLELRDTLITRWPGATTSRTDGCAPARSGGVWIGGNGRLLYVDPHARRVRTVPAPPLEAPVHFNAALHDSRDRVWVTARDLICHAPAASLLAAHAAAWECDAPPDIGYIGSVVELPGGTLWAASERQGLLALRGGGWRSVGRNRLATPTLFSLEASPSEGVWMLGHGVVQRVRERGGDWEVLEQLTAWHGLPGIGGGDLVEDDDGTLWIATANGVVQVPPDVRFGERPAPRVALVEVGVDSEPLARGDEARLPHDRNHVELRFAALSYRDPASLRHQVRLDPGEPWIESAGRPSFRWTDLPAGAYAAEYRASLDGESWSAEPVRFGFTVLSAWYRTPWFTALAAVLFCVLGWLVYRARVAYLVGLERQRTRIAMDLHDEVGSGLASVGILSGVLAADGLHERERRAAATEIAAAAEDLGYALSDIVWSLDPRTATLQELAARLAEQGDRLCADGTPEFAASFPAEWPSTTLDVALRRNVLLIGLEALHNAVRHARATRVTLSLLPAAGTSWELTVRDDGRGLPKGESRVARRGHAGGNGSDGLSARRGRGLQGMQRRAEEIGAQLHIGSPRGAGTAVVLRFELPRALHIRSRLRAGLSASPPGRSGTLT